MGYKVITLADGRKCYSGPNCVRHAGKQATSKTAMNSELVKKMDELDKKVNPLASETPVSIDTTLAPMYNEYFRAQSEFFAAQSGEKENLKKIEKAENGESNVIVSEYNLRAYKQNVAFYADKKEKASKEMDEIKAETEPYEAEFRRRGGWTRAFIVTNTNGHVHKSMNCSTCFPTTSYGWLPEYSGADENKIVEDAGSSACTVCYPNAPTDVLKRKSVIEDPQKRASRLEREAAKLEREKKANEKGITNPDGSPLTIDEGSRWPETIKSYRTAEIKAVDIISDMKAEANPDLYPKWSEERRAQETANYNKLLDALAAKHGKPREELDALYREKGEKKYKKFWF